MFFNKRIFFRLCYRIIRMRCFGTFPSHNENGVHHYLGIDDNYDGNGINFNFLLLHNSFQDGDKFWRMNECYIRGSTIKYLRIPDEVIDLVKEDVQAKSRRAEMNKGGNRNQNNRQGGGGGGGNQQNNNRNFGGGNKNRPNQNRQQGGPGQQQQQQQPNRNNNKQ